MKWSEYVSWTDTTAVYPEAGTGSAIEFAYVSLGLMGELGELMQSTSDEEALAEFGDLFWYLARAQRALEIAGVQKDLSNGWAISSPEEVEMAFAPALVLGNTVKKLLRDGVTTEKLEEIAAMLSDLFSRFNYAVVDSCEDDLGQPIFEAVLDENVKKLSSRKERGKIKGSGNDR